jgi:hypothetical protein
MDSEYHEPSWRGPILTVIAVIVGTVVLVLLLSNMLQQACDPGTVNCVTPSVPPPGG